MLSNLYFLCNFQSENITESLLILRPRQYQNFRQLAQQNSLLADPALSSKWSNEGCVIFAVTCCLALIEKLLTGPSRMLNYWASFDRTFCLKIFSFKMATSCSAPQLWAKCTRGSDVRALSLSGIAWLKSWSALLAANWIAELHSWKFLQSR